MAIRPNKKNLELFARADGLMPGPHSNMRKTQRTTPIFISHGKGARLWDVDGNEYIDYVLDYGPGLIGHGNQEYNEALKAQVDTLIYLSTGEFRTAIEVDLAEKFCKHTPVADEVRFCLAGTEAVQLAIRLARAYTKRRYFVRFEGHYHGWMDNILGGVVDDNATGKPFAVVDPKDPLDTEGRDPAAFEQGFKIQWNDADILEDVLKKWGDEIAVVMMEPILCNGGCCPPRPGYLEKVRELCTQYGVVLYFDEVITGFRAGLNSAQGLLGVTPDISTFGKAIGGGLPLAAVAGKRAIMDQLRERTVIGAGTFNGYPMGLAGSLAALTILERDDGAVYQKIDKMQRRLMNGMKEAAQRHGLPLFIQGPTGVFAYTFLDLDVAYSVRDFKGADWRKVTAVQRFMDEEGIYSMQGGRWFLGAGHTGEDIDKTLEIFDTAMGKL